MDQSYLVDSQNQNIINKKIKNIEAKLNKLETDSKAIDLYELKSLINSKTDVENFNKEILKINNHIYSKYDDLKV